MIADGSYSLMPEQYFYGLDRLVGNKSMEKREFKPEKECEGVEFKNLSSSEDVPDHYFENCSFHDCRFSDISFKRSTFTDCRFVDCDLSLAKLDDSVFNGVVFQGCRLLGIDWRACNTSMFSCAFESSSLDSCVFDGMKLRSGSFLKCSLCSAMFEGCDLQKTSFSGSNLRDCSFSDADLRQCDFRDTQGLSLDLERGRFKGLKLDVSGAVSLIRQMGMIVD